MPIPVSLPTEIRRPGGVAPALGEGPPVEEVGVGLHHLDTGGGRGEGKGKEREEPDAASWGGIVGDSG